MRRELLTEPKFLVPLMFLLWFVASLPLSVSQAGPVDDPACLPAGQETAGVWGQPGDPFSGGGSSHLTPLTRCYQVLGPLVWGEWWRDKAEDCDLTNVQTAYNTCSDSDMNWYMRLSDGERRAASVTSGEIKKIQRFGQCKKGVEKTPSQWCNFMTETIPEGGNYGDEARGDPIDPTDDKPALHNPCLDKDWGGGPIDPPCKGININFTGTLVKDNNHGWKEVHPVRKEIWTEGNVTRTCTLATPQDDSCPSP